MEQYKEIQSWKDLFWQIFCSQLIWGRKQLCTKSENVDLFFHVLIHIFIILNTFINLILSFEPSLGLLYFDNK